VAGGGCSEPRSPTALPHPPTPHPPPTGPAPRWALAQDERTAILARSRHIPIGLEALPNVARRLHHCRDLGLEPGGAAPPFDFLTWCEASGARPRASLVLEGPQGLGRVPAGFGCSGAGGAHAPRWGRQPMKRSPSSTRHSRLLPPPQKKASLHPPLRPRTLRPHPRFEYAPQDEALFEDMVAKLRATEEWRYVEREVDVRLELAPPAAAAAT
jgi:hypothetical protein